MLLMNYFRKILIPADFSVNTNVAVKKAIELNDSGATEICLFHVCEQSNETAAKKLDGILNTFRREYPGNAINANLVYDYNVESAIIRFSSLYKPDLIIIGKNNSHYMLPFLNTVISGNIASATRCPVLTVKPGALNKKTGAVIMPVCDYFPRRKIELLFTLNRKKNLDVHLLTILRNNQQPDSHSASALLQSIKYIKSKLDCNVHHNIIHSNNGPIAALRYAEKVNADILLLNQQTETSVSSWISKKDITDIVNPASGLQVLRI